MIHLAICPPHHRAGIFIITAVLKAIKASLFNGEGCCFRQRRIEGQPLICLKGCLMRCAEDLNTGKVNAF